MQKKVSSQNPMERLQQLNVWDSNKRGTRKKKPKFLLFFPQQWMFLNNNVVSRDFKFTTVTNEWIPLFPFSGLPMNGTPHSMDSMSTVISDLLGLGLGLDLDLTWLLLVDDSFIVKSINTVRYPIQIQHKHNYNKYRYRREILKI